jgi:hypothetical protein
MTYIEGQGGGGDAARPSDGGEEGGANSRE